MCVSSPSLVTYMPCSSTSGELGTIFDPVLPGGDFTEIGWLGVLLKVKLNPESEDLVVASGAGLLGVIEKSKMLPD